MMKGEEMGILKKEEDPFFFLNEVLSK